MFGNKCNPKQPDTPRFSDPKEVTEHLRSRGICKGAHVAPDGTEYDGIAFRVEAVSAPHVLCRGLWGDIVVRFDARVTKLIPLNEEYVEAVTSVYDERRQQIQEAFDQFQATLAAIEEAQNQPEKAGMCDNGSCRTPSETRSTGKKPTPKKKSVKS